MTVSTARPVLHHLAITVTDLEASVQWYSAVFDLKPQFDVPHPGGVGRLLLDEASTLAIVLHEHEANGGEQFAETRTGLDHFGLMVPSRPDLERWQDRLAEHGVERRAAADRPLTQSPISDEFYGSVMTVRDPDNIAFEIFCPPAAS